MLAKYGSLYSPRSIQTRIGPAHEANTRKYWLVEVNENNCIVTHVGVYDEISPRISGNPLYTPPLVTIQLQNKGCFSVTLPLFTDLILWKPIKYNSVCLYTVEPKHYKLLCYSPTLWSTALRLPFLLLHTNHGKQLSSKSTNSTTQGSLTPLKV